MSEKTVIAKAKNVRGSARKARIPADVVRGMMVEEALPILKFMPKKAAADVYKVVHSARSNAVHNNEMNPELLKIKSITVSEGMRLKRMRPKSRGMADVIQKKFNHIVVELVEVGAEKEKTQKSKTPPKADKKNQKVQTAKENGSAEIKTKEAKTKANVSVKKTVKPKKTQDSK